MLSSCLKGVAREPPGIASQPVHHQSCVSASGPDVFVVLGQDRAISPRRQRMVATNLDHVAVVEIDAGHEVMFSAPELLAALVNRIADGALGRSGSSPPDVTGVSGRLTAGQRLVRVH